MPENDFTDEILTEKSTEKIKFRSIQGSLITLPTQVFQTLLQVSSVILIARYFLLPEDFGLFAVVFAVLNFLIIFKDGGLSISAVQIQTLTKVQLNTLFWLNLMIGFGLTLISLILSVIIYGLYQDERLLPTGFIFSLTFLFAGASIQTQALMRRQMRFTTSAVLQTVSVTLAVFASLFFAWKFRHPAALAVFHLVFEISQFLGFWILSNWKPNFSWKFGEVRHLVNFGGNLTAYQTLVYIRQKSDNLLISWFGGVVELGFYERAYQILLVPLEQFIYPLGRIVHSSLSRLQNEPAHFRSHLLRWILFSTSISMPVIALLFGVADRLIPFLLGDKWTKTALLFKALAPGAFIMTVSGNWIFIPLGRIRRQFRWTLFSTAFLLTGFCVGVMYGALGVAVAYSICRILVFVPELVFTCKDTPVSWGDILRTIRHPVFASLAALGLLLVGQNLFPVIGSNFLSLARDTFFYCICYFICWIMLPNGLYLLKSNFLMAWNVVSVEKK